MQSAGTEFHDDGLDHSAYIYLTLIYEEFMMKMAMAAVIFALAGRLQAESVSFKINPLQGVIEAHGITPEQAQVVLRCQFIKNGIVTPHSEARPQTRLEVLESRDGIYRAKITSKAAKVWDFLPSYKLHNCSFNLMIIARHNESRRLLLGDYFQLGQLNGQMSKEELQQITNTEWATESIKKTWNPLVLRLDETGQSPEVVIE